MEELLGLFSMGILSLLLIIAGIYLLPCIITIVICYNKGQSGCLGFLLAICLPWFGIGVIIALCLPNIKRQEEQHREMLAAITSQNHSPIVIANNQGNEQNQSLFSVVDFRLQAIRNLKAIGKPFDNYDLEIEIEKVKKENEEFRLKEADEQNRKRMEEQARAEEEQLNIQRIKNEKRTKILTRLAIVIGVIILLAVLVYAIFYLRQNHQLNQEEMPPEQHSQFYIQDNEQQPANTTETYYWMCVEGDSKKYPLKSQIKFTDTEIKCITTERTDTYILTGKAKQKNDNKGVWEYPVYYSKDKNQKIINIVKGPDYTMIIYDDEGYYEIFSKTKPEHYKTDDIEDILQQSVVEWNGAHSSDFVNLFTDLYDSNVLFYGITLSKDKVYSKKQSSLQKSDRYKQTILEGNIEVKQINENEYRCDFVKRVIVNQKTDDYPSYLVFKKINNKWKIVVESDEVTDKNLLKKTLDEILNFPEIKAIENVVTSTFEPTDDGPYYTVKIGQDMETHVATYYWFHIYKNPYKIMYYDVATDSEMTLEQWRNKPTH